MRVLRSESGRNVTNVLPAMALCLVSVALTHSAGPATPNWNTPPAQDFPLAGGSYSNQRYSALSRINRSNITKLGGVWSMRVEEPHRGGTLDYDGLVFLGVAGGDGAVRGEVAAYDVKTGKQVWRFSTIPGPGERFSDRPVSTFEADGEQYVAVIAGGNNILLSPRGDFLWTFKLGGTLPQAPPGRQPPLIHPAPPQRQP